MVFVGYGVVAPEYGWDDYKGLDVKGKTVVMLINDPAVPDPNDPAQARPFPVQGEGDDLLRPLDLQVRDRLRERGRGLPDRPRGRPGGLPLSGRRQELGPRELRPLPARRQHRPGDGRRLARARQGQTDLPGRRPGLRRPQEGRGPQGFQARPAEREGRVLRPEPGPPGRFRRTWSPGSKGPTQAQGRASRLHRALGPPRPRPQPRRGPDLQRRGGQRLGHRRLAGDRPGVHLAQDPAETIDPVPRRSPPRRKGSSGRSITPRTRSIPWKRRSRTSTWT